MHSSRWDDGRCRQDARDATAAITVAGQRTRCALSSASFPALVGATAVRQQLSICLACTSNTLQLTQLQAAINNWQCVLLWCCCRWRSDSLTVIKTPQGIDSNNIVKHAYSRYNLSIGIGLSQVGGAAGCCRCCGSMLKQPAIAQPTATTALSYMPCIICQNTAFTVVTDMQMRVFFPMLQTCL